MLGWRDAAPLRGPEGAHRDDPCPSAHGLRRQPGMWRSYAPDSCGWQPDQALQAGPHPHTAQGWRIDGRTVERPEDSAESDRLRHLIYRPKNCSTQVSDVFTGIYQANHGTDKNGVNIETSRMAKLTRVYLATLFGHSETQFS